jgi:hypothetical protein
MLIAVTLQRVLAWVFVGGFVFLVATGAWAIITVTRMKREQEVALGMLHAMAARMGLKEAIDKIQTVPALWGRRVTDFPPKDHTGG